MIKNIKTENGIVTEAPEDSVIRPGDTVVKAEKYFTVIPQIAGELAKKIMDAKISPPH